MRKSTDQNGLLENTLEHKEEVKFWKNCMYRLEVTLQHYRVAESVQ